MGGDRVGVTIGTMSANRSLSPENFGREKVLQESQRGSGHLTDLHPCRRVRQSDAKNEAEVDLRACARSIQADQGH